MTTETPASVNARTLWRTPSAPDGAQLLDDILDERGWLEARGLLPAGLWTAERLLAEVSAIATRLPSAATEFVQSLYAADLDYDDVRLRAIEIASTDRRWWPARSRDGARPAPIRPHLGLRASLVQRPGRNMRNV